LVDKYIGARKAHFRVLMGQYSAMVVFKVVVTFGLLALGGLLVMNEQMNIGQFVAAEIVILLVINAVEKMIMSIESVYDVLTAVEKIANVTDLPLEKPDGILIPATCADSAGLRVEYRKVGFRSHWSGSYVLREIDLKVEPGEKLCIAGPPGA
ncbi:MAG: ABC transporter ATP-binding protein, partial [Flavobacteriales bacterium]|nr:ABC transporter ATP-binding protein [Flavobacteriales bacterium]